MKLETKYADLDACSVWYHNSCGLWFFIRNIRHIWLRMQQIGQGSEEQRSEQTSARIHFHSSTDLPNHACLKTLSLASCILVF